MTTTIVDELMALVAAVIDASGLDFSAYVAARSKLESRLRELLEGEAVAWLHQVVCGDGESDQALSFAPDNFPLQDVLGYRSLSHEPLYRSPRPFDAASISDERIDAGLDVWFDSEHWVARCRSDAAIAGIRADFRAAIATLVQP